MFLHDIAGFVHDIFDDLLSVTDIWGSFIRFGVPKSPISALKSLSEGPKWRPGCDFGTQGRFLINFEGLF